ncbi:unannotated protein [freshwater metagenome]|uniref:Unannotated protein n=1 Tax=freshwater metagenome TaxID=449393 RepID=A0A6J7HW95_9ZZZZ
MTTNGRDSRRLHTGWTASNNNDVSSLHRGRKRSFVVMTQLSVHRTDRCPVPEVLSDTDKAIDAGSNSLWGTGEQLCGDFRIGEKLSTHRYEIAVAVLQMSLSSIGEDASHSNHRNRNGQLHDCGETHILIGLPRKWAVRKANAH